MCKCIKLSSIAGDNWLCCLQNVKERDVVVQTVVKVIKKKKYDNGEQHW